MKKCIKPSLIPFDEKHLENTLKWVNDPEIMAKINRVLPVTSYEHKEWFKRVTLDQSQVLFAIEDGNGKHIGNCGLKDIDIRSRKAELWIYLGESAEKGYGVPVVKLLIQYGLYKLNLNRIYLYTLIYNQIAYKTFRNAGFEEEGRFRQDVYINGAYHDTIRMAVLRDEYRS